MSDKLGPECGDEYEGPPDHDCWEYEDEDFLIGRSICRCCGAIRYDPAVIGPRLTPPEEAP